MFTPGKRNIVYVSQSPYTPRQNPTVRSQIMAATAIQRAFRARRRSRVPRVVSVKPEMKYITYILSQATLATGSLYFVELTQCAQGTARTQRVGDRIRVHRVEICGIPWGTNGSGSSHVVAPYGTAVPLPTDFEGNIIPFYKPNLGKNLCKPLIRDAGGMQVLQQGTQVWRNKRGVELIYQDGSASPEVGKMFWVCYNNSGANVTNITGTARIWFTDV